MILFEVFWWIYLVTHYQREEFMLAYTWDTSSPSISVSPVARLGRPRAGALLPTPSPGGRLVDDHSARCPCRRPPPIVALYALGLWIFRGSNDQKNRFKGRPAGADPGAGRRTTLGRDGFHTSLSSGWWGVPARHPFITTTGEQVDGLSRDPLTHGARFASLAPYTPAPLGSRRSYAHRALLARASLPAEVRSPVGDD